MPVNTSSSCSSRSPRCGRLKLRRLIGPGAAIVFKGSGFYCTDYRSESYKRGAAAEKSKANGADGNGKASSKGSKSKAKSKAGTSAS